MSQPEERPYHWRSHAAQVRGTATSKHRTIRCGRCRGSGRRPHGPDPSLSGGLGGCGRGCRHGGARSRRMRIVPWSRTVSASDQQQRAAGCTHGRLHPTARRRAPSGSARAASGWTGSDRGWPIGRRARCGWPHADRHQDRARYSRRAQRGLHAHGLHRGACRYAAAMPLSRVGLRRRNGRSGPRPGLEAAPRVRRYRGARRSLSTITELIEPRSLSRLRHQISGSRPTVAERV